MKNKGWYKLLAFALFMFGFSAIVMQLVGVQWIFLAFIEIPGKLFAFLFKIVMVLAGVILFVLSNTDWEEERRDSIS